jgi:cytochrome c oxidase subunit 1
VFRTDHRSVGLQYAAASLLFLLVGFLLVLLIRWQLAYPGHVLPAWLAAVLGQSNAPGGIMLPEFYNQLVAMHGTVMIFLAVVPLATGAFGTLLVPSMIGAGDTALPRTSLAALWLYVAGGAVMLAGFFVEGGAASSGWTSYVPLAVLASPGQTCWLVGMLLVGVSATLWAVTMMATIVTRRAPGLTWWRLPFFVWAQFVTALLLLLAFPSLKAAAIFQLMDRVAGTSFFLPTGLVIGGIPLQDYSGGGNALMWQHLFWFLAHPEVYVLILPAMGIVAEVIAANTRQPLWGYRLMVAAVLFLAGMSLVVWAHHMFLTGMTTSLGTFFQVTTVIVSVPSVVVVTALVMSMWGGSIRFPTAMLFALAFLPMFGLGGLTGLPLALAASNVTLHDTYYVVAHFHYLVAPGTVFALVAGVYHWFPAVTGRRLDERLGKLHFWLSLFLMNNVFLPMFVVGLRGVHRRLYDAGLEYALAEPTFGLQRHMTWSAIALGVVQLVFVVNLVRTLATRSTQRAPQHSGPEHSGTRHPGTRHPGTRHPGTGHPGTRHPGPEHPGTRHPGTRHPAGLAPVLLMASVTMLLGSLAASYVLLRTGASTWGSHPFSQALVYGGAALVATAAMMARRGTRWGFGASAALGAAVVLWTTITFNSQLAAGLRPATDLAIAFWYTLTGTGASIVFGLAVASASTSMSAPETRNERARTLGMLWWFAVAAWLVSAGLSSLG